MGVIAVVGSLAGIGLGLWRLSRFDDASRREAVQVRVEAGRSLPEAEAAVAVPLEEALARAPGVQQVEVRTAGGVVRLVASGAAAGGEGALATAVRDAVARALPQLPADGVPPLVSVEPAAVRRDAWTFVDQRIAVFEVRALVDARVAPALQRQPGVRAVKVCGPGTASPAVKLDLQRLRARGLDARAVLSAVRAATQGWPAPRGAGGGWPGEGPRPGGGAGAEGQGLGEGPAARPDERRLEGLSALRLAEGVLLRDVAVVFLGAGPPECLAFADGSQVVLVSVASDGTSVAPAALSPSGGVVQALPDAAEVELWAPGADHQLAGALGRAARQAGATHAVVELRGYRTPGATATVVVAPRPRGEAAAALVRALTAVPGATLRAVRGLGGARVLLRSLDEAALAPAAAAVAQALGAAWAVAPPAVPELVPELDRARLVERGLSAAEVAEALQLALGGVRAGAVTVTVAGAEAAEAGADDAAEALGRVEVAKGVRLGDVAQLTRVAHPAERLRVDRAPAAEVLVPGGQVRAVRARLEGLALPTTVTARVADDE